MPPELKDKLAARAAQRKRNVNDLIVETLSERLGGKEPMASTNGKARRGDDKVRVAIIGVGNCASSLVQGVEYYKDANPDEFVPGLMHVDLGGYHISDIEFTAAFDVTTDKVGKDLSEAIWAHPNNTIKFSDVPKSGVTVSRGMTHEASASTSPRSSRRRRARPTTWSGSSRRRTRTSSSTTSRSAPRRRPSGTRSRSSAPAARW